MSYERIYSSDQAHYDLVENMIKIGFEGSKSFTMFNKSALCKVCKLEDTVLVKHYVEHNSLLSIQLS